MPLQIEGLERQFKYGKGKDEAILPDPNPEFTVQEVMQFYAHQYPDLTTATIDGPKVNGDKSVYHFKTTVGTKS